MNSSVTSSQKNKGHSLQQIIEGLEGVFIIIAGYLTFFLKPVRDHWGIRKEEAKQPFPGDELVADPKTKFTHAVVINAPAEYVWPWVAQIGQGRGGFYSYELLENIAGLNIYNSDEVLPEFQHPKVGDFIPFSDADDGIPVARCAPGQYLAIENRLDLETNKQYDPNLSQPKNFLHLTWLWKVEPINEYQSRFISRNRVAHNSSLKSRLMFGPLAEPIVFAMDRKMCLGIKKRAERLWKFSDELQSDKKLQSE